MCWDWSGSGAHINRELNQKENISEDECHIKAMKELQKFLGVRADWWSQGLGMLLLE